MTEFLSNTLKISDMLKIGIGVLIPITVYMSGLEKRISILEWQTKSTQAEISEIKQAQERIENRQIKILQSLEKLNYAISEIEKK